MRAPREPETRNTEPIAHDAPPPMAEEPGGPVEPERVANARRRMMRFAIMGGVLAIGAAIVLPRLPRAQHVRVHIGPGSTRIVEVTARVGRDGTWDRETSWRFERGAPPTIGWELELPNGVSDIEVELSTKSATNTLRSRVELTGNEARIEVGEALRSME